MFLCTLPKKQHNGTFKGCNFAQNNIISIVRILQKLANFLTTKCINCIYILPKLKSIVMLKCMTVYIISIEFYANVNVSYRPHYSLAQSLTAQFFIYQSSNIEKAETEKNYNLLMYVQKNLPFKFRSLNYNLNWLAIKFENEIITLNFNQCALENLHASKNGFFTFLSDQN